MQQTISVSRRIAQQFQQIKGIFSNDPIAVYEEGQADFTEYLEYLMSKGLSINNLQLARFRTDNNLPYLGLQATQNIENGSTLVQVPRELMLTTKIAYFSDIQEIFDAYPQFYCQQCSGGWQDQILLTYILYQSQLGSKSQWYHLIKNLPRDIDYLIFWSDEELKLLNDETLILKAKKELKDFELVRDTLTKILDNYPQYFKKETYSHDNIKWIFIHLVSRCFGSSLEQVAFVPFCEMFNHENTDVCYQGEYLEGNPHAKKAPEEVDESDESDGDSDTYDEDDYQYPPQVQELIYQYKNRKPGYKVIEEELTIYQNNVDFTNPEQIAQLRVFQEKCNNRIDLQIQYAKSKRWFQENLNLRDNFTILFVSKSLEFIKEQIQFYDDDILTFQVVSQIIEKFNANSEKYLEAVKLYSQNVLKCKTYSLKQFELPEPPQQLLTAEEMIQVQLPEGVVPFQTKEEWQEDKFDNFIIKCSSKDHFDKGSQVYFSYGTLSNRSLLLRYGFTLQYNIYDYVTMKVQYIETIPYANDIADYFQLSKYMKFKLKYNRINDDLLMYCKLQRWSYDQGVDYLFDNHYSVEVIQDAQKLIQNYRDQFPEELNELTQQLKNEKLGYHEYFALIYRIEKLRILDAQLEALQILKCKIEGVEWSNAKFEWTKYLVDKQLK